MRALDLFCGAGGVAAGLLEAGFTEVVGVDINPRCAKVYPGRFIHGDATRPPVDVRSFDLIWASPPCQRFSTATPKRTRDDHPDLIEATRRVFDGHPMTVIENVPNSPIRRDVVLTGPMVGLNRIARRRHFECSAFLGLWPQPITPPRADWVAGKCITVTTSLSCPSHYYHRKRAGLPGRVPVAEAREAMGVHFPMTAHQLGESVPPAYARAIGERALQVLRGEPPTCDLPGTSGAPVAG